VRLFPLLLAGCAARHPLCHIPPAPLSATAQSYQVQSADGLCLQGYEWAPGGSPRGAVVVVHGIRDHASRYEALAQALTDEGLLVVAQDHRGHGLSGGKRQRFDSLVELQDDVQLAVQHAQARAPGVPVFLFGHSLGGLVSTTYALERGAGLAGLILSAPALQLPADIKPSELRAAKLFGTLTPGLRAQEVDDTVFVREPSAKAELASDPWIDHVNLPAASARAFVIGIEALQPRLESLTLPVLALHGRADVATDPKGSEALIARAQSQDKTLRLYDGMFHDLWHEPEAPQLVTEVAGWLRERVAGEVVETGM
jgi:acylglycerol lipase